MTHPSLSTGLLVQAIDSGGLRRLEEAHFNLDISDFSPLSKAVTFHFYTPTEQFLTYI